jgi:ADP-ribose pyrophosphatase YjhB (NUDIX family)
MEDTWLTRAKRLQAIASTGLHFCDSNHDRERYVEIAGIAQDMLADLGTVPLNRIRDLVPDFARGYATPLIDVRGAVIEDGRILLVQEATDGKWAMPGGFADVGLSAAQNVEKEIREEAGIAVAAHRLYAVRHKARGPYPPDARDFYKVFFLCDRTGPDRGTAPSALKPGHEALDAEFFAPDALPPLSTGRIVAEDIVAAFAAWSDPGHLTRFD